MGFLARMRSGLRWWAWLLGGLITLGLNVAVADTPAREFELKAVFLYHFAQFTDWPANAFPQTNSPIVIGILGEDPFGRVLDETIKGERINGHGFVIKRSARLEDVKDCHLLFISQSENSRLPQIMADLKERSILTVGESERFAQTGGMIRLLTANNKIRLRINTVATKRAQLTLSSKLLRLAEIVPEGKD